MRFLLLASMAVLAASAVAKEPQPAKQRLDAIWSAVNDRLTAQIDVWFDDGDFPAVIQLLKVQYEMFPSSYDIATNLGWMQENVERWDDAIATYMRFQRDNPSDPDAALALADFYFRRKAYGKIPPLLETSIKRRPHPNAFRILAHAYSRLGMLSDSLRVWDAYLAIAPSDGAAKANREKVLKKMRDPGKPKA